MIKFAAAVCLIRLVILYDDMKLLAVDAKEKGVYGKNCVFDCTYVSRRVAHYDDEVRHR